jgi:hypothetical protein
MRAAMMNGLAGLTAYNLSKEFPSYDSHLYLPERAQGREEPGLVEPMKAEPKPEK